MNDKYIHYRLNDYLEDEEWINHVREGKWDEDALNQWGKAHPETYSHFLAARKLVTGDGFKKHILPEDRLMAVWQEIDQATSKQVVRYPLLRRILPATGIAASILLVGVLLYFTQFRYGIRTENGEQLSHLLPDKSGIELNASSHISYNRISFSKNRTIRLDGEAFFTVNPGTAFTVRTPAGDISVLGTSFNVYSRSERMEVRCHTGKVLVVSRHQDSLFLKPGQMVALDDESKRFLVSHFVASDMPLWRKGVFEYTEAPLALVLEELERQFDVEIRFEDHLEIDSLRYTGLFVNDDLDKALIDVCWPMHFRYDIKEKTVFLSGW